MTSNDHHCGCRPPVQIEAASGRLEVTEDQKLRLRERVGRGGTREQRCPGTRSLPLSEHWEEPEYLNGGLRSATAPDLSGTCHPQHLGCLGISTGTKTRYQNNLGSTGGEGNPGCHLLTDHD